MIDNYVDPDYACAECGKMVTDLLSPVCYECRQQMTLIKVTEYDRLLKRIEKLRWALGVSANQVRTLKKEVNGLQAVQPVITEGDVADAMHVSHWKGGQPEEESSE